MFQNSLKTLNFLPVALSLGVIFCGQLSMAGTAADSPPRYLEPYREVLESVDDRGMVDYAWLKQHRSRLDRFASELARLPSESFENWSNDSKIAFWINAYNGLTLLAIVDHYPIESSFLASLRFPENSIRQISGVWEELEFEIMGRPMTLDQIEHEVLRVEFDEPRIHMALVCAAMSCPPLRSEPFTGPRLDSQLNGQTERFLGHPEKFRIESEDETVYLSRIFDWFGEDFVSRYGTDQGFSGHDREERAVLNFISQYLPRKESEYLKRGEYSIDYLDYDWSLNER